MIPCYSFLEQSTPTGPARQSRTLDLPRTAHRLYSITTVTYKHSGAIMQSKQGYRLEQYTNSKESRWKIWKTNLRLATNTQTRRSQKSDPKRKSYDLYKISYRQIID